MENKTINLPANRTSAECIGNNNCWHERKTVLLHFYGEYAEGICNICENHFRSKPGLKEKINELQKR